MNKLMSLCISFMLLFAAVDLSAVKSIAVFNFDKPVSVSDIVKTQLQIYNTVKHVVSNVSDIIINDINMFIVSHVNKNAGISVASLAFSEINYKCFIGRTDKYFINTYYNNAEEKTQIPLKMFLLWLVLMYLIRYIGLLKTFWNLKYNLFCGNYSI